MVIAGRIHVHKGHIPGREWMQLVSLEVLLSLDEAYGSCVATIPGVDGAKDVVVRVRPTVIVIILLAGGMPTNNFWITVNIRLFCCAN